MKMSIVAAVPLAAALALGLGACAPSAPEPEQTEAASQTPTAEPTETQAPAAKTFTMPADCTTIIPGSRVDSFAAQNISLLGGPGGKYPTYFSDPTPEEQAGGLSCVWGDENIPETTVIISVAPLSLATRAGVVDNLLSQGLNEATLADSISYAQIGDDTSAPAILNIIRDDSWISVIETLGGEAFFEEATQIADEVSQQTYVN